MEFYKQGNIKSLTIKNGASTQIYTFDSLGNCKNISKFTNGLLDGEQLTFYKGYLVEKARFKADKANGHVHEFYPISGAIQSHRFVLNGLERGLGIEYYDGNIEVTKSALYFNDSGMIFYKQNYDSAGHYISEEWSPPESVIEYRKENK